MPQKQLIQSSFPCILHPTRGCCHFSHLVMLLGISILILCVLSQYMDLTLAITWLCLQRTCGANHAKASSIAIIKETAYSVTIWLLYILEGTSVGSAVFPSYQELPPFGAFASTLGSHFFQDECILLL